MTIVWPNYLDHDEPWEINVSAPYDFPCGCTSEDLTLYNLPFEKHETTDGNEINMMIICKHRIYPIRMYYNFRADLLVKLETLKECDGE